MGRSFICDHCGQKVSIDAEKCPICHHLFKAVRCSQCSYSGQPKEFISGCPVCHFFGEKEGFIDSPGYRKNKKSKEQRVLSSPSENIGLRPLILLLMIVLIVIGGVYFFLFR